MFEISNSDVFGLNTATFCCAAKFALEKNQNASSDTAWKLFIENAEHPSLKFIVKLSKHYEFSQNIHSLTYKSFAEARTKKDYALCL